MDAAQAACHMQLLETCLVRGVLTGGHRSSPMQVECWTYGPDAGMALLRRLVAQGFQPDRATWSTLLGCEPGQPGCG